MIGKPELHIPVLRLLRSVGTAILVAFAQMPARPASAQLPASELTVRAGSSWRTWWRSGSAPREWRSAPLAETAVWGRVREGVELAELEIGGGSNPALRWRVIVARLSPERLVLSLKLLTAQNGLTGAWTVDDADTNAVLAVNAGQFEETGPWGWLVLQGQELRFPAVGPLSAALVIDTVGRVHFVEADRIEAWRRRGDVRFAFQSYPVLLQREGQVPAALTGGRGVDLRHRDIRLAIGQQADGKLLVILTRYSSLGRTLSRAPYGPTTPEMAAIVGALGARRAVALDGGISAQMMIRPEESERLHWRGFRRVPLALEVFTRN